MSVCLKISSIPISHDNSVDKRKVLITTLMVLGTVPGLKPSHAKTINLSNKITRVLSTQGNIMDVTATVSYFVHGNVVPTFTPVTSPGFQ